MTEPIQPALTAEEWAKELTLYPHSHLWIPFPHKEETQEQTRHRIAALTLYGQPFGFTWETVDLLLSILNQHDGFVRPWGAPMSAAYYDETASDRAKHEIDKIAALLPPRETVRISGYIVVDETEPESVRVSGSMNVEDPDRAYRPKE